jgi:hypothetical protein
MDVYVDNRNYYLGKKDNTVKRNFDAYSYLHKKASPVQKTLIRSFRDKENLIVHLHGLSKKSNLYTADGLLFDSLEKESPAKNNADMVRS